MALSVINSREDLDAIIGTAEHDVFMSALRGSLWRLEKDDEAGQWVAVEENSVIERFGFSRADFPGAVAPQPPEYAPPASNVPNAVTMRQARLALLQAGLLDDIETAINSLPSPQKEAARIEWEYSQEVQRHNGFVSVLAPGLGLTELDLDQMFVTASKL